MNQGWGIHYPRQRTRVEGVAIDLRTGDLFDFGYLTKDRGIMVESVTLTDDGMVGILGVVVRGSEKGFRGAWSTDFTEPVVYER